MYIYRYVRLKNRIVMIINSIQKIADLIKNLLRTENPVGEKLYG